MFFNTVDEAEVKSIVLSSKAKASLEYDNISMFKIQEIVTHILKPLIFIFNMSLKTGLFPLAK